MGKGDVTFVGQKNIQPPPAHEKETGEGSPPKQKGAKVEEGQREGEGTSDEVNQRP